MNDKRPTSENHVIAILGGTGALGTGLALRWAECGHRVVIGSRVESRARDAVVALKLSLGERGADALADDAIVAMDNRAAAQKADIAVLTVPYAHQRDTLGALKAELGGKILVDVTVPLVPPKVGTVQLPQEGSAALVAQNVLGNEVRVVSAFQNVAASKLRARGDIECDVLVCSDDEAAAQAVVALAEQIGMRAFHAGPLANAVVAEAMTSVLVRLNKRYRTQSGIRITGIPD